MLLTKTNGKTHFNDVTYSFLKRIVQVILPACGALYFTLGDIWGLPRTEEVVGTIACITTFLGVSLGLSSNQYDKSNAAFDGHLVVEPSEETGIPKVVGMHFDGEAQELDGKKSITLKIRHDIPLPVKPAAKTRKKPPPK